MLLILAMLVLATNCYSQEWTAAPKDWKTDGEVVKINVIYRHGHKEYKHSFPRDPHKNSASWIQGPNQLTKLGREQAYSLGDNLRKRYMHLIPEEVSWKCVRAYSSDTARTMMSSAAVLAGLIVPEESEKFSYLDWQPIPIHTDPILGTHLKCPRAQYLMKLKHRYYPSVETQKLYKFVSQQSGTHVSDPRTIFTIYSSLEIQRQAKMVMPLWAYPAYSDIKREAAKVFHHQYNPELTRLRFGRLLKRITHFNDSHITHPINLYCTHDTVIGGILAALKINVTEPPNFGAAILIEFRIVGHLYHAQLWYRSGPSDMPIRIPWPKCGIRCPVKKLERILKPLIPEDWATDCEIHQEKGNSLVNLEIIIGILLTMAILCVAIGYVTLIFELLRHKVDSIEFFRRISPKLKSRGNYFLNKT